MKSNYPRIAIIGCGAVTETHHLPVLASLGIHPTLLADVNVPRAQKLADAFQVSRVSDDYRSCVGEFDAAIVAAPHYLHAPVCIDLLRRGVHTLVEKPMARTAAECAAMNAAAEEGKAVLAVGLMRRFQRNAQWVKAVIDAGRLGPIESFEFQEGGVYNWPVASGFFFRKETAGGGVMMDTGAHTLDFLLWWLGDVASLEYFDDNYGGVEADCRLQLTLASGAKGVVELSRTRNLRNTAVLRGQHGQIEVGLGKKYISATPKELLEYSAGEIQSDPLLQQTFREMYVSQTTNWLHAIESRERPLVSGVEGARAIKLIDACYQKRQLLELPWVNPNGRNGSFIETEIVNEDIGVNETLLTGKKVLVTGATGFIGGRLVEKLVLEQGADVRALVRNFTNASRISRFNLEMVPGSITDAEAIDRAVAGCDTVFHCAHDFVSRNAEKNLEGATMLADACLRHSVRRLVHVSTVSVYEPIPDGDLDESTVPPPCDWLYPKNKLAVENMLLQRWKDSSLPVVVIQPTIVYGPFGGYWTIRQVELMRTSRIALPIGGLCNAVYVDDVVNALILATEKDEAVGERFLISGAAPVTWREFYGAYERMLEVEAVVMMPAEEMKETEQNTEENSRLRARLKLLRRDPRRLVNVKPVLWMYKVARSMMGKNLAKHVSKSLPPPMYVPVGIMLSTYKARSAVRIDKARRLLGYQPAFDLTRGMNLTAEYVRWAKL